MREIAQRDFSAIKDGLALIGRISGNQSGEVEVVAGEHQLIALKKIAA